MRGALLVALVGRDEAFDLEHITPNGAPAALDEDGVGVFAGNDCPAIANSDQLDDLDHVGNARDPASPCRPRLIT